MSVKHRAWLAPPAVVAALMTVGCNASHGPGLGELMNFNDLRDAIKSHDERAFVAAYDELTAGCNSCHQAANFGFNVVKRPAGGSWFSNQAFTVGQ